MLLTKASELTTLRVITIPMLIVKVKKLFICIYSVSVIYLKYLTLRGKYFYVIENSDKEIITSIVKSLVQKTVARDEIDDKKGRKELKIID